MCDLRLTGRYLDVNVMVVYLDESFFFLFGLFINIKFSRTIFVVSCVNIKLHGFTSDKRCHLCHENLVVL